MKTLLSDLRYAGRMFWKSPGFTAAAVLTLALGIGVIVAVFSLLHAALVASLPVPNPDRLVQVTTWTAEGGDHFDFSYPLYVDLRDATDAFTGVAAYTASAIGVSLGDRSERIIGEFVTSTYFHVLGVRPALGPGLSGDDELRGSARVAVLSDGLWRRLFAGDRSIVGKTLLINGQIFTVVGVAPRGFEGIVRGQRADLWASVSQFFPLLNESDRLDRRTTSWVIRTGGSRRSRFDRPLERRAHGSRASSSRKR
ncbi:MAG: ABC transporter permease [Vicinamibacterales bacterium]